MSWNFGVINRDNSLKTANCPSSDLVRTNRVFVNENDFSKTSGVVHFKKQNQVYLVSENKNILPGQIGINSIQRRELRLALGDPVTITPFAWPRDHPIVALAATFEVDQARKGRGEQIQMEQTELGDLCARFMNEHIPTVGQSYIIDFYGTSLVLTATALVAEGGSTDLAIIKESTAFYFAKNSSSSVTLKGATRANEMFRADFNFEKMGIGGLDREFSKIFRRAFASRVFPPSTIQKLGITHVKGMLLYGPPGTGKTLIARQIGKILNAKEPKVVNGPEVLDKYVGGSEENVRKLFEDAETDAKKLGDDSDLHIIIFDEIDAICRQRGTGDSTGTGDRVVNQLLSKIDGVNALNNILVIGMTNRKDLIDDALLRPGRLEVHVEISLPDEHGRLQILRIHTTDMRKNDMLEPDVDLQTLAAETKNYSGAEIAGVCKSAGSFALNRNVDLDNIQASVDSAEVRVTIADFNRAIEEVQPAFGLGRDDLESCLLGDIVVHGEYMRNLLDSGRLYYKDVRESERSPLLSVLIEGPAGSGKTAVAAQLAMESKFPFVRMISPEAFVGLSEGSKCRELARAFDDAHKSPLSVIVLDDIERMIEYSPVGPRFSNVILQTLMVLTKKVPRNGRRLLIMGTTSCGDVLRELDYKRAFSAVLKTKSLVKEEIERMMVGPVEVLKRDGSKEELGGVKSVSSVSSREQSWLTRIHFPSRMPRDTTVSMLDSEQMGIKKMMMVMNIVAESKDGQYVLSMDRLGKVMRDVV